MMKKIPTLKNSVNAYLIDGILWKSRRYLVVIYLLLSFDKYMVQKQVYQAVYVFVMRYKTKIGFAVETIIKQNHGYKFYFRFL